MNTQLKEKQYLAFFSDVESHFRLHSEDYTSASKLSTAVAFHLYFNPCEDAIVADRMGAAVASAFHVMTVRAKSVEKLAQEDKDKASTASVNILTKGFLREAWLQAARKTVGPFQHFFRATADKGMLEFMLQMEKCLDTMDEDLKQHKDIKKEVRQLLKENHLTSNNTEWRLFNLYHFHLELLFLKKRQGTEVWIANANALIEEAISFCNRFGIGALFKSKHAQKASRFLELADRILIDMCQMFPSYVPTSKLLPLYHYLYDLKNDLEDWDLAESALRKLDKILLKIESSKSASSPLYTVATYQAFAKFSFWRLTYEELQRKVKLEVIANSKLESAPVPSRDGGTAEEALAMGDSNPYILCLTLDAEEELLDLAKGAFGILRKASEHKEKVFVSTSLTSACILRMTLGLSEFFKLIGHQEWYIDGIHLLLASAREFDNDSYKKVAQSILIRYREEGEGRASELIDLAMLSDSKDNIHQLLMPAAIAWRSFFSNNVDKATQVASSVLKYVGKQQRDTSSGRLLSADMKHLLTLGRCAPNSFVICPNPSQLPFATRYDGFDAVENGPLEHICDSFKDAVSATHCLSNHKVKNLLWCSEMIRANNVHVEVVCTRTEMYMQIGLPMEMRLYGKLRLELTQKLALSTRTSDSLLVMAEIDLRCDNPEQALVKLNGVKHILGTLLLENGSARSKLMRSKSPLAETNTMLAASPALHYLKFSIPSFIQHPFDCNCSKCSNIMLPLVVLRYYNLLGVWYHMMGECEAAISFFDGASKIARLLTEKIETKGNFLTKETACIAIFNALQWQVECHGRSNNLGKAIQLLAEQKTFLSKIPAAVRKFPHLRARYYHQLEFLRKDGTTISDGRLLTSRLASLALSPSVPTIECIDISSPSPTIECIDISSPSPTMECIDISSPSNFRTPVLKSTQRLPQKPTKKQLPFFHNTV
ncbi:unnamed protein product [Sphagnum tenellum]